MPKNDDLVRLRHMFDAAQKLTEFTKACNRKDFEKDEKLTLAVVRLLEILGEAAKYISDEYRQKHTVIPWRQIAGTRDRLIHGYFDIDFDIIWKIVSEDIPLLVTNLQKILPPKPSTSKKK